MLTAAVQMWAGPRLVCAALGTPDWHTPTRLFERVMAIGLPIVVGLIGLLACGLAPPGRALSRWSRLQFIPATILLGLVAAFATLPWTGAPSAHHLLRLLEYGFCQNVLGLQALWLLPMLALVGDTLRRTNLRDREFGIRAAVAASSLWLVGVWSSVVSAGFSWACFGPVASAELAAYGTTDTYPFRVFCGALATSALCALLWLRVRRDGRPAGTLMLLFGLAGWLASRTVIDLITVGVAGVVGGERGVAHTTVTTLGVIADFVEAAGTAAVGASWTVSWLSGAARACGAWTMRSTLSAVFPLLAVLWLATSPVFEPPLHVQFPQQAPEAVWTELRDVRPLTRPGVAGNVPFYQTRSQNVVVGVLSHGGDLHVFRDGRASGALSYSDVVEAPTDHFWSNGVQLVVDERATLGDLRRALRALRLFEWVYIIWRHNELYRASGSARARWSFVDMASRALRTRPIALIENVLPTCTATHLEMHEGVELLRCALPPTTPPDGRSSPSEDALLVGNSDNTTIAALLDATGGLAGQLAFSVDRHVSSMDRVESLSGGERPRDPLMTRFVPRDSKWGVALGTIAALVALLVGVAREQLAYQRRAIQAAGDGPYRHPAPRDWRHALARTPVRRLLCVVQSALARAMRGTMRWVFVAVVACAAGFALPLLYGH